VDDLHCVFALLPRGRTACVECADGTVYRVGQDPVSSGYLGIRVADCTELEGLKLSQFTYPDGTYFSKLELLAEQLDGHGGLQLDRAGTGPGAEVRARHQPIELKERCDFGLDYVVQMWTSAELNLRPDYQRGHAWTAEQQGQFLGYLLSGGRTMSFIFRDLMESENATTGYMYEVVDGQQRLSALIAWWLGLIPAVYDNGDELWSRELSTPKILFLKRGPMRVSVGLMVGSKADAIRAYLKLNTGGTVHTQDDLDHARAVLEGLV
jgi:hypothetical protein